MGQVPAGLAKWQAEHKAGGSASAIGAARKAKNKAKSSTAAPAAAKGKPAAKAPAKGKGKVPAGLSQYETKKRAQGIGMPGGQPDPAALAALMGGGAVDPAALAAEQQAGVDPASGPLDPTGGPQGPDPAAMPPPGAPAPGPPDAASPIMQGFQQAATQPPPGAMPPGAGAPGGPPSTDPGFIAQILGQVVHAQQSDQQQLAAEQHAAVMTSPILQALLAGSGGVVDSSGMAPDAGGPMATPDMGMIGAGA